VSIRVGDVLHSALVAQVLRFGAIGIASTLAYVALYAVLRTWLPATVSNALALVVTAIGNTAANRRLTFAVRGGQGMVRHQAAGLAAFGIALAITTSAIWILHAVDPTPGRWLEIAVLVAANAVATAIRFLILRQAIAPAAVPAQSPAAVPAQSPATRTVRRRSAVARSRPSPSIRYPSTDP
jgi:putative flippase GtrA